MDILQKIIANTQAQILQRKKEIGLAALRGLAEQRTDYRGMAVQLQRQSQSTTQSHSPNDSQSTTQSHSPNDSQSTTQSHSPNDSQSKTQSHSQSQFHSQSELSIPAFAVIAELKKASPSKGLIREEFDPQQLAPMLQAAGATALSVLTETDFFLGSPEYLKQARAAVKIPVLRKDFIVQEYQIYEAIHWGADALLLIAAALDEQQYHDLYSLARELGIDVLTEVHSMQELEQVMKHGAQIVGVNARNLRTFKVDLDLTAHIISEIPSEYVRIAESGIQNRQHIQDLVQSGANGFLIGETLMKQPHPGVALQQLLGVQV
jgi:indole-3-glycerol phosphate synthase